MRHILAACFILLSFAPAQSYAQQPASDGTSHNAAQLQGLNKVTARVSALKATTREPIEFGTLEISLSQCWVAPDDERPEQAALLNISQHRPDGTTDIVFSGWMFASSPGLSALEHPVYDITLMRCGE